LYYVNDRNIYLHDGKIKKFLNACVYIDFCYFEKLILISQIAYF